ncbi:MAG: MFS transporter [Labilithrix sp.]|nr:MFS transporter [Labilithrix sp.]MBX3224447.1 MFS transporter [Labilithrix sp.]
MRRAFARIPDKNVWTIYTAILLLGVAYGVSIAVLAIHLKANGIPEIAMGGLAAAFALGIVSLSIPSGWVVQRFGAKKTLLVALAGYAACVSAFPFLTTTTGLSVARFFDGAFSVAIWVAAETALLSRSHATNKAFVMSLYAMSLGLGYVFGPLLAIGVVAIAGTSGSFIAAGVLALIAAIVILARLDGGRSAEAAHGEPGEHHDDGGAGTPALRVLWKIKTACLATFSYGYFQASVVLYLPLFLIQSKGVPKERTILITAFFALGMLLSTTLVSRLGDRYGHLLVMRALGAIGGTMVASFVLLSSFAAMCVAVFVAGATLAAISPVSLALQGVVVARRDLGRANALYNAAYAAGMLIGPPVSSVLFTKLGGGEMLLHLAAIWATFVAITLVFANDDPKRAARRGPAAAKPDAVAE